MRSRSPHAGQLGTRVIELKDVFVGYALVAHDDGSYLAKAYSVSPPSSVKHYAIGGVLKNRGGSRLATCVSPVLCLR